MADNGVLPLQEIVTVRLPHVYNHDLRLGCGRVRQVIERGGDSIGRLLPSPDGRAGHFTFYPQAGEHPILIATKATKKERTHPFVLQGEFIQGTDPIDLTSCRWVTHPRQPVAGSLADVSGAASRAIESWANAFSYIQEDIESGQVGLRNPQLGALHAIRAHWTVTDGVATIVMPTGTGKTEVMLSLLVAMPCERLLVVVPTDALRTQTTDKFLTLGVLTSATSDILRDGTLLPVVATLHHVPKNIIEIDSLFAAANVVVTTSSIAGRCAPAVQERIAHHCPYLFIDEAHHAEAPTWRQFRNVFTKTRIVQFTATPFREDGRLLNGEMIYKYPLRKAQEEGYFKPIRFVRVAVFNQKRADEEIARAAVDQLRTDRDRGHILMARAATVARAREIYELYRPYADFQPVELHSGVTSTQAQDARRKLLSGESRIVVCVDMLGEGFDLPELKIAAFHDIRKSLAVTLQLAGRFTRSRPHVGDATFIANVADVDVQQELRQLYARDPDWNALLPELSEYAIGKETSLKDLAAGFLEASTDVPIQSLRPATSMVAYKTHCLDWTPQRYRTGLTGGKSYETVLESINESERMLVIIAARRMPMEWATTDSVFGLTWELYVLIWWKEQQLLFINGSTNAGEFRSLAKAVVGEDATLIDGQIVFRSFAGINRLRLQNVGLSERLGRNVQYTGRMGTNVEPALSPLQRGRAFKSVIAGYGFESGRPTTIGASRRGRIWSHSRDRLDELAAWCKLIGTKLLDDSIDPDAVLRGTLTVKAVSELPTARPIAVSWPDDVFAEPEKSWNLMIDGQECMLGDVSLGLGRQSNTAQLTLQVAIEAGAVTIAMELTGSVESSPYKFTHTSRSNAAIRKGQSGEWCDLTTFFNERPPTVWYVDGSSLEGNLFTESRSIQRAFDSERIEAWDWQETNIQKESQGHARDAATIQYHVLRQLDSSNYRVIVDDDGPGEAADIVAIQLVGREDSPERIEVDFLHCKYSHGAHAGSRLDDLYEVCGQAQRSVAWLCTADKATDLFTHLLRRSEGRQHRNGVSRIELGDEDDLRTLREISRVCPMSLRIWIVQPGLSQSQVSVEQLQLLSVTDNYLTETYQVPLRVIGSA